VAAALAEEVRRSTAFEAAVRARLARDLPKAFAQENPRAAIAMLLARERRYTRAHVEAAASRAAHAVEREHIRRISPYGALWLLDPTIENCQQCVVADTLITGPQARRGFRRQYSGQLVEVVVASGEVLRITPHHPVLTPRGWWPAGALREGDQVFRDSGRVEGYEGGVKHPHDVRTIEQVVESIEQLPTVATTTQRVQGFDFHGDGTEAEVRVVATDRRLLFDGPSGVSESASDESFFGSNPTLVACPSCGAALSSLFGEGSTSQGVASSKSRPLHGSSALGAQGRKSEAYGFAVAPTDHNAASEQLRLEGLVRDTSLLGQSLDGLSGVVALDQVVEVRHFDWSGDVFNLSTEGGWYTANGMIVQNCLRMGGRVWPWEVIDAEPPPIHARCGCQLAPAPAPVVPAVNPVGPGEDDEDDLPPPIVPPPRDLVVTYADRAAEQAAVGEAYVRYRGQLGEEVQEDDLTA